MFSCLGVFACSGIAATSHPIIIIYHCESYINLHNIRLHSFGLQLGKVAYVHLTWLYHLEGHLALHNEIICD